ncbi:hypothetical protein [Haloferax larsenii]|uniref:Profilin fold domain-containing protein n=1 Tax=Haloferax larsenii TaxID=302484 RepID=A0A1H7UWS8_HALLR|nr:hypothetical protein [Haloferax larsenii]ELZ79576.1 hypothetical protein C455_08327 [Haloferax larsenii JCM 13917]UVE50768.1 hypothetical protein KU306_02435 [Haloferax larsenii]SEM01451.1 hypothetical protein SAMN04488691_1157 [Haloferax larsenii]
MTDALSFDVTSVEDVAANRDEVVSAVQAHAGTIARELAILQGGDYGQETFKTRRGTWTLKYEAGAIQYLRFKGKSGGETYVVSTKQPPEPKPLATAMQDYPAFVEAYNEHVESLDGVLDDVPTEFPSVTTTEELVSERDRIVSTIREVSNTIAGELTRFDGEYGTFAQRVNGTRWELKWDGPQASYLRVGGEGGVYLVSQYQPPSAPDVRELAEGFVGFVEAYNEYVEELEADLATVSFEDAT